MPDARIAVLRPQLERAAQVPQRLVERARVLGLQARPRPTRAAPAPRSPAARQCTASSACAPASPIACGDGAVDRRALARQQVGVDGLAHDVVAERERVALAVVDEQVVVDRVAQRGRELRLARARRRRRAARRRRRPPDRGRVGQQPPGGLGHAPQPHAQRVGQPGGELLAAGVAVGGQQLLGEQRVAAAALVQLGGQRGLGRAAEDPLELGGHALAAERRELGQRDAVVVLQLGEHLAHRVGAAELAGAEADRDGRAAPGAGRARGSARTRAWSGRPSGRPRGSRSSGARRPSAPSSSTIASNTRACAKRSGCEPPPTGSPEPRCGNARSSSRADLRAQLGQRRVERLRRSASRSSAASGANGRSPPSRRRHSPRSTAIPRSRASRSRLTQQAALADARLTDDQRHRRIPLRRPLERDLERLELRAALHEAAAGDTRGHAAIILRRWRASSARPTPTSAVAARRSATASSRRPPASPRRARSSTPTTSR